MQRINTTTLMGSYACSWQSLLQVSIDICSKKMGLLDSLAAHDKPEVEAYL